MVGEGEAFGYKNLDQATKLIARMLTLIPRYRNANAPTEIFLYWAVELLMRSHWVSKVLE